MSLESRYFKSSDNAKSLVKSNAMVDTHIYAGKMGWPEESLFANYFGRAKETGINVFGISLSNLSHDFETACDRDKHLRSHIELNSDWMSLARNESDVSTTIENNDLCFFYSAQGAALLNGDPGTYLHRLKSMGLGTLSLTYNFNDPAGDGCMVNNPLPVTDYGKQIIEGLIENRIALDVSHMSDATALTAIAYSRDIEPDRPVLVSHSTPNSHCESFRNISDELVKAVADTNGVIAINTSPMVPKQSYVNRNNPDGYPAAINTFATSSVLIISRWPPTMCFPCGHVGRNPKCDRSFRR